MKQRIDDEMLNVIALLTSVIFCRLSGNSIALMLVNTFLVTSRSVIDSLLTWIESFSQELKHREQSIANDAWLLVCSCIFCYFKELRTVQIPDQATSNIPSATDSMLQLIFGLWSKYIVFHLTL